jgi:hypothetical protein
MLVINSDDALLVENTKFYYGNQGQLSDHDLL